MSGKAGLFSQPPSDASNFNPTQLDTDQWLEAASKLGARYAVLVAKHCSGFSLWPAAMHDYSVKKSPWKGDEGDAAKGSGGRGCAII
ncbi:MAG: alpha-L-fucosidase [Candidatus Amulumruptor sp.]|nr:alpha-L-fucosidase [Candidatus Amulumruptor sp.]MDE7237746.1 alpha-L-fucosidase [Paramuribaculum sp.]